MICWKCDSHCKSECKSSLNLILNSVQLDNEHILLKWHTMYKNKQQYSHQFSSVWVWLTPKKHVCDEKPQILEILSFADLFVQSHL